MAETEGWALVQSLLQRRSELLQWKNMAVLTDHEQTVLNDLITRDAQIRALARMAQYLAGLIDPDDD